jgi:hypothetical protein
MKGKLKEPFRTLLLMGVKSAGNYDPADVLPHIEEQLTQPEYQMAEGFLSWCKQNGKMFGHATIERQFLAWIEIAKLRP